MQVVVAVAALLVAVTALPYAAAVALYGALRPGGSPEGKAAVPAGEEPTVSVVLPTYDEAEIVEGKLEELCGLEYPDERLEIVVVDDSDDGTAGVVRSYVDEREGSAEATPTLTLIDREERAGVAAAVNEAVAAAGGEIVLRTDADSTLAPDVLREAVATLSNPAIGAVTGRQSAVLGDSAVEADYRDAIARLQALETAIDSTFICHGPCTAFRRAAFTPIDPDSLADDTEIGVQLRRAGHRVVMDPAMRFAEAGTSSFAGRRGRKDRRAMGLVRLLVQHRDALGRYGRYGRVVLPFNWWFMIVSPWLLAVGVPLVAAAAGVLAAPYGLTLPAAAAVPAALIALGALGSRDALGPLQPLWAVLDAQASLLVAAVRLLRGGADGTWEPDRESREAFE